MQPAQRRCARTADEIEVAGLDQAERGSLVANGEFVTNAAQEGQAGL